MGKGLDAAVIIELILYATVNMIQMGLPLAVLLATIMAMGNLGENYELLAMKSAGMSLLKIVRPLVFVVLLISIGSFFIINNLAPYSNKKMFSIIHDIQRQNQALEFQDGLFFNGIDNMSIRVEHQNPETKLLTGVLIYDNRSSGGNMTTTIADSGYIRLSEDKRYLLVTLFNGSTYEHTRSSQWYNKNSMRHHSFERQDGQIPMTGFDFERTDENLFSGSSQTQNIVDDKDVTVAGKIKDLFSCVRDLLYVGFRKYNPVENVQEVGDILDDYHDESKEKGEKRGIMDLFAKLTEELMNEGFLADLMNDLEEPNGNQVKVPQDHKKPQKTKASLN